MQALCLDDKLAFVADYPDPERRGGEALVRVLLAGICGTDLELLAGYHDFRGIPGHEFVGLVEECDDPRWLGKRVVGEINIADADDPRHAPDRRVLGLIDHDGVFADFVTLPERNLHEVPDAVPNGAAVFCEPLAAAIRMLERITLHDGDRVAVLGPGRLGLLQAQVLALLSLELELVVLGHRSESLEAADKLELATDLSAYLDDSSFDTVIDTTGSPHGLVEAIRLTRPQGTIGLKSTFAGQPPLNVSGIVVKELNVVGSRCGPFDVALRTLARGRIDCFPMIEAEYPLRDGLRAFEHAAEPGALKVLLSPWCEDRELPAPPT